MPLTNKAKQANRNAALNIIARSLGYESWGKFETAVKKGEFIINQANPPRVGRRAKKQEETETK